MNYNLYHAEDFAADESFMAYYFQTDIDAVAFWTEWIALHPEKIDEIYNAEQLLAKLSFRLDEHELQEEFAKFNAFLIDDEGPAKSAKKAPKLILNKDSKWLIAAAVLIVAFIGTLKLINSEIKTTQFVSLHNGDGKITTLTLTDGTKISLASNSTLKYPKTFSGNKREISLEGEAYFEVAKDKSRPFSVTANGIKTTVLGTKFNISAYANSPILKVALLEGKVAVQTAEGRDRLLLKPYEMANYDPQKQTLSRSKFSGTDVIAWKDGNVVFDNDSFEAIALKMNQTYGLKLVDQTSGLSWHYSGRFEKSDYLSIIKSICFAKKIKYKATNKTIILFN